MRITVVRRGFAIIQTPNKSIYSRDIWDTRLNEKIESDWVTKNMAKPKYSRLTTFRGFLTFPKLSDKEEIRYQLVKDNERNLIIEEERKFHEEEYGKTNSFEALMKRLENKGIKNMQVLEGFAVANNMNLETLKGKIRDKLSNDGKDTRISNYFWTTKTSQEEKKKEELRGIIESIEF